MKYGICHLSIVPCRLEPADTSEMVTQLLFGETVKVYKEHKKDWYRAKTAYDDYECWIDIKQIILIEEEEFNNINSNYTSAELVHIVEKIKSKIVMPIVLGSTLPNYKNKKIDFAEETFSFDGQFIDSFNIQPKNDIIGNAMMFINTPYLWGGRSPFGVDCSGFTQIVYKLNGIKLPRDASQQAEIGDTLSFIEESESGDLAFFDNEEGNIIHVGIMLKNNRIIHASGKVRIDKIDHQGIFNIDTNSYSHRLRLIKKII